jgi:hypothetical protein
MCSSYVLGVPSIVASGKFIPILPCAVPPAYYAHLAPFRKRYYDVQAEGTNGASVVSGGPAALRHLPQIKDKVKEVMFFC